jgi:ribonuclease P protein component
VTHQARFRRSARLRLPTEFQRCFTQGERVNGRYFRMHLLRADSMRLGLAVSRKVDPDAVGRNRIKRVAREFFRTTPPLPQPGDCVLVAKPEAARASTEQLRADLAQLWRRAAALKPTAAAGTMRDASPPPASTSDG